MQNVRVRTEISPVPSIFFQQGTRWSPSFITDSKSWWYLSIGDMHERSEGVPGISTIASLLHCVPLSFASFLFDGVVVTRRFKYGTYKWPSSVGFALTVALLHDINGFMPDHWTQAELWLFRLYDLGNIIFCHLWDFIPDYFYLKYVRAQSMPSIFSNQLDLSDILREFYDFIHA